MARKDISDLVRRYEQKLASGKAVYFDADEFDVLAEYYDAQNDVTTAREIVEDGLKIHPESASLRIKQTKFLVYDGEYAKALAMLGKQMPQYDFDLNLIRIECYLQLGMHAEAYLDVKEILENETEDMDTVLSEIGFLYVEADSFDEAVLYLEKSLEFNPDSLDVLGDLAYAYEMLGNFEAAIITTNKILDIDPYSYEAWVNIGKLYSLQDDFEKAVDAFDFALTINDKDSSILKLKAHCLSLAERYGEAIEIFNRLLDERPGDTSIFFLLAECYQAMEWYDDAIGCLVRYSEAINSGDADSDEDGQEDPFLESNNMDTALSIVKRALNNDEYSVELNLIAGDICFRREKYEEAEVHFRRAYATRNDYLPTLDRLAVTAIKNEDYSAAIEYTDRVLALNPDYLVARQRLALLYFELNDQAGFNKILDGFSDEELHSLFNMIYLRDTDTDLTRDELLNSLNSARETRTLFKNLKY